MKCRQADRIGGGAALAQRTFSCLCLVSKRFLPIARSHLYYRPFIDTPKFRSQPTRSFLRAIESNRDLGRLVGDLDGIGRWMESLWGDTRYEWYLSVLRACVDLVHVDIIVKPGSFDDSALDALLSATSTLKRVTFKGVTVPTGFVYYGVQAPNAVAALGHSALQFVKHVQIQDVPAGFTTSTGLSNRLETLSIGLITPRSVDQISHFIPRDPSTLTSFALACSQVQFEKCNEILSFLPSTISSIHIAPSRPTTRRPTCLSYRNFLCPNTFSLDSFLRFPSLQHLTLEHFRGPSNASLERLVNSSPLLFEISFAHSIWTRQLDVLPDLPDTVFSEDKAITSLDKLRNLRYINLGYLLQTTQKYDYQSLKLRMSERKVNLQWSICES